MKIANFQEATAQALGAQIAAWFDGMVADAIKRETGSAEIDMDEVKQRGLWLQMQDGRKIFCWEGKELIAFYPIRFEQSDGDGALRLTATQDYKILA